MARRSISVLVVLTVAACKSNGGAAADAGPLCACDDAGPATAMAATSASSAPEKDEPDENDVECEKDVCRVMLIDDDAKAELEKVSSYKSKKLVFREGTTEDQLRSITNVPWVTRVGLDGNKDVADLSPLAELKGLKELTCEGCEQVNDLTPLAGLTEMERLVLARTGIESIAALKGMTKMTKLDISSTKVSDLGAIAGMKALKELSINQLPATDYNPLAGLTAMRHLEMTHSSMTSAYLLQGMKDMRILNVSNSARLSDITPLRTMSEMDTLKIDDCPIVSLAPLAAMLSLHVLSAAGTKVNSLAPVANLTELRSVDLKRTPLQDFDDLASSAKSLKYLGLPKGTTPDQYAAVTEENHHLRPDVSSRR